MTHVQIDEPIVPGREGADWGVDPDSGAVVVRLTSAPAMNSNIYCEQPYASPDGRRFLIARTFDPFGASHQLFVADLQTLGITQIEPDVPQELVAHTSWGEWAYYLMHDGSVRRLSLMTLKREAALPAGSLGGDVIIESITPDNRLLIGYEPAGDGSFRSFTCDTHTGEKRIYCQGPSNRNPHAQADLSGARRVLHQLVTADDRQVIVLVIDLASGEQTTLPLGGRWSAQSSGHMAWIADTGRVACALDWRRADRAHDPRHPQGNLAICAPGDAQPTIFTAPEHGFYHVSVSRCGRYFVCDDFMDMKNDAFSSGPAGPVRIVVGNLQTGKYRTLLRDCQAYGIAGSSRFEPDPYFTADNRHVIYNASPFGLMQVFAARVPEAFLASLD